MAAQTLKTLRDALARRQFDSAYYIFGEDEFQKDDAVRQLVQAVVDPATRDFNLEFRSGGALDPATMASLVDTPPLMAERRVAVIREVNALRKDSRAVLDAYLRRPSPDTVLLLVASPGATADKALQQSTTPLEFDCLDDLRVPRWIAHYASTEFGATIAPPAAELLHSAVGNDLYQIATELDKLVSYSNGAPITEDAITDVVGVRPGETLGDLLDAVLERDAARALVLLPHVLTQPKTTAVSIVMALSVQMLALAWGRARLDDGLPVGRLEGEYFSLLKTTGAFPMRPWGAATRAWARAVPHWSAMACDRAADAVLAADVALKETRVSSDAQILATALLALCAADGTPAGGQRAA